MYEGDFTKNYDDFLDKLHGGDKVWTVNRIKKFLKATGNPQENFHSIHITGTNGKGTVANLLFKIYSRRYRAGLFTSPHLVDFRERIATNDGCIEKEWINEFIRTYKNEIKNFDLTYFEVSTAMAFHYFSEKNVDLGIVEVGLGGKKDATNVLNPLATIITYVDFDHPKTLGPSLYNIAEHKSGIIKRGKVLTYEEREEILNIFREKVRREGGELLHLKDYIQWNIENINLEKMEATFDTPTENYEISSKIVGKHQCRNIGISILTAEILSDFLPLSKEDIINGVNNTIVPARFQIIEKDPIVVIDGAHNPSATKALSNLIKDIKWNPNNILIGMMRDKPLEENLKNLSEIAESVIFVEVNHRRRASIENLFKIGRKFFKKVRGVKNVIEGYRLGVEEGDLLITGSFYLCGEILKILKRNICELYGAARI